MGAGRRPESLRRSACGGIGVISPSFHPERSTTQTTYYNPTRGGGTAGTLDHFVSVFFSLFSYQPWVASFVGAKPTEGRSALGVVTEARGCQDASLSP